MKTLIFTPLFFLCSFSFGQTNQYQNLLDAALSRQGASIVSSKPIKHIRLSPTEMENYFYFHRDYANAVLDTIMFAQIIQNSKSVDTTLWEENELKNYFLVRSRDANLSIKYATRKLGLTDKKRIKFYKKQFSLYNSTASYDRNLYYFSRPVFDNSKKYAIVHWDNGHSGLGGGGGLVLYQLEGGTWKEIGLVINWKY